MQKALGPDERPTPARRQRHHRASPACGFSATSWPASGTPPARPASRLSVPRLGGRDRRRLDRQLSRRTRLRPAAESRALRHVSAAARRHAMPRSRRTWPAADRRPSTDHAAPVASAADRSRARTNPASISATPLHQLTGADLAQIDGIGPYNALRLLSEIGTDMTPVAHREALHVVAHARARTTRSPAAASSAVARSRRPIAPPPSCAWPP